MRVSGLQIRGLGATRRGRVTDRRMTLEVLFLVLGVLVLVAALGEEARSQGALVPERPAAGPRPLPSRDVWPEHTVPDDEAGWQTRQALPFTQEQIRQIAEAVRQARRATVLGEGLGPQGRMRRIVVEPGSGESPPVIDVRHRWTTVISFRDATGSPWPIESTFLDEAFTGEEAPAPASSNLVYVVPRLRYLSGNLVVKLKGLAEPVIAVLRDRGEGESDFGVELRLTRPGPDVDAAALVRPTYFTAGDEVLFGLLGGVIPVGAIRLELAGGGAGDRAWRLGEDLLLVTRHIVLSPGTLGVGAGLRGQVGLPVAVHAAGMGVSGRA